MRSATKSVIHRCAMDKTTIIGIDCATVDSKVGLALGTADSNGCIVERAAAWTKGSKVVETVVECLDHTDRALIALDAPLGWPRPLGRGLADHRAGSSFAVTANELFRRETDRHVKKQFGKQPLDVGADRIAGTAVSALNLLGEIRRITGLPIPLAWQPDYKEPLLQSKSIQQPRWLPAVCHQRITRTRIKPLREGRSLPVSNN